jgi:hypothetical protein
MGLVGFFGIGRTGFFRLGGVRYTKEVSLNADGNERFEFAKGRIEIGEVYSLVHIFGRWRQWIPAIDKHDNGSPQNSSHIPFLFDNGDLL